MIFQESDSLDHFKGLHSSLVGFNEDEAGGKSWLSPLSPQKSLHANRGLRRQGKGSQF